MPAKTSPATSTTTWYRTPPSPRLPRSPLSNNNNHHHNNPMSTSTAPPSSSTTTRVPYTPRPTTTTTANTLGSSSSRPHTHFTRSSQGTTAATTLTTTGSTPRLSGGVSKTTTPTVHPPPPPSPSSRLQPPPSPSHRLHLPPPHGSRLASPTSRQQQQSRPSQPQSPSSSSRLSEVQITGARTSTTFPGSCGGVGGSSLSKLPTSMTSGGSPKRSSTVPQGRNKIVSPTRVRSITDRLPLTKTATTPVHEHQHHQGWKTKPMKEAKEKTSEYKAKGVAVDIPSIRREKREVMTRKSMRQDEDGDDDNDGSGERRRRISSSRGNDESHNRKSTSITTTETRVEAKTIPKRKKSERSNSDAELKKSFKKMANPSTKKVEESTLQRLLQEPSEETASATKPLLKMADKNPRTAPVGKGLTRPTTLKIISRARPTLPQRDQLHHNSSNKGRELHSDSTVGTTTPKQGQGRSVEERLRDMDLDGATDEVDACQLVVVHELRKFTHNVDDRVDSDRCVDEGNRKVMYEDDADVLSEEMKSPDDGNFTDTPLKLRSDMDDYDDEDDGVAERTPSFSTTHDESSVAIYHDKDDDDNDNLTLDDHEPLSSDTGTYSLDWVPDYEHLETHHYSLDTEFDVQDNMLMLCGVDGGDEDGGDVGVAKEGIEYLQWKTDEDREEEQLRGTGYPYVTTSSNDHHHHQQQQEGERRIEPLGDQSSEDRIELHIEEAIEYPHDQRSEGRTVLMIVESCEEEEKEKERKKEEEEEDCRMVAEDISTTEVKEEGKGEKLTTYTIPENLPIGDVISFPSCGTSRKPQMDEEEDVTQTGGVTSSITSTIVVVTPPPPTTTTTTMTTTTRERDSRRKARPGEIKRDTTAPKARVSDARHRDANNGTRGMMHEAAATRRTRKKKKSREEESSTNLKVNERRSKRKMETEKTREGMKKSARLFVDKDVDKTGPRPSSPCLSDVSTSSGQSQASTMSRVSTRLPIRALHASGPAHSGSVASLCSTTSGGGGGSRGSTRDTRGTTTTTTTTSSARQNGSSVEKKRVEAISAPPRRPRLDNIKSTIPKPGRLPPRNNTDPVKAARPGGGNGPRGPLVGHNGPAHQQQQQQHPAPHADQLRRLEAEVAARVAEARAARSEREETTRGLEALTVLLHHLTTTYDPFSTPRLKAEVVRLNTQLTEARLNLDESSAAVRRAQDEAKSREEQHQQDIQQLHQQHQQALELLRQQHKHEVDSALEKHRKELAQFAEDQETQRAEVSRAHTAELEQLEGEWHNKLDIQHEKHLCALQDLNTQHTHKLRELETSRRARERELEDANYRLSQDQEALRQESRKLQETLLNDTDHRLLAVRKMCASLKSEVDSLKTVVDMKNTEIHELRGQVVETERLGGELEAARERVRALQAKTEDLQAQMEKRVQQERHLVNEHRLLLETFQRESNTNKRLSLENEELAWKLRQREEIMSTSMPSSTLDLVSRAGPPRHQEGAASPQAAPRSPRVAVRSPSGKISPSKCDVANKQRRSRLGLSSEDGERGEKLQQQEVSFESPPPSPCVKAVVEKSNSVSFILDLNDSQSDDSFLDLPPSPRPRPQRTASLSAVDRPRTPTHIRRVIHNNRANSLNRNGTHGDAKPKDFTRKPKEMNGKGKELHDKSSKDMNGKSLEINGRPSSRRTTSESSEGGSEVERISPTGLAWTVPVHQPKSPVKIPPPLNGSPVRKRIEHHLLEDPDEDEYEETPSGTHQFIEVVGLTSSSEAASDSELSQCDIKEGSSTDSDSDSSDGERLQKGNMGHKSGPWCPKEGAGEAMITDELLKQYAGDQNTVGPRAKRNGRRRIPSAPSSDSDENVTPHNEGNNDVSWSEDVDITSSSEMHEL